MPLELLQRMYQISSFLWTPGMTTVRLNFPGSFSAIPTLANVLSRFAWFRADLHIEVKMQSTPYHQGSLLVGWVPTPGTACPSTTQMISGYDATVLSASTQDTCIYEIPYLHPCDWLTTAIGNVLNAEMSCLFIQQLNTLVSSAPNIALSIPIFVFASFKNIKVTGYQSQMKTGPKFQKNSEASTKQKDGVDAKTLVSAGSQLLRQVPLLGSVYSPIADALNMFAGNLSKPVSTECISPIITPYYADVNQVSGVTNATTLSLYPNPVLKQAPTMFGMETSHISMSGLAQRPLLHDTVIFNGTDVSWESAVHPDTKGAVVTGRDYLCSVAAAHRYWRGSIKYLVHFCMPAFYSCRVRFSIDYMGGGSPNNYGDLMTRYVDIKGDTWQEITVPYLQRTTWSDRAINSFPPYLKIFQFTPIVGSSDPATPIMYVNIWRSAGEDIEFSGLLDTDTIEPYQPATTAILPDGERFESQTHIGQRFKNPFPGINTGETQSVEKGLTMPEITGSVSDVLKRHQALDIAGVTFATTQIQNISPLSSPLGYFSRFFMFWRGGRIQRRIHYEGNGATMNGAFLGLGTVDKICNGWAPAYANSAVVVQPESFHVPYLSAQPYYPAHATTTLNIDSSAYVSTPVDINNQTTTSNAVYTLAAADDLVLLHIVPWGCATTITPPSLSLQRRMLPPKKRST